VFLGVASGESNGNRRKILNRHRKGYSKKGGGEVTGVSRKAKILKQALTSSREGTGRRFSAQFLKSALPGMTQGENSWSVRDSFLGTLKFRRALKQHFSHVPRRRERQGEEYPKGGRMYNGEEDAKAASLCWNRLGARDATYRNFFHV